MNNTKADSAHSKQWKYNSKERFNSYWHQLDELVQLSPNTILEIGKGSGLVSSYLQNAGFSLTSIDILPSLGPDVIADAVSLPFPDNTFDMAACFQVLEHLPYELFVPTLTEISRVVRTCLVISLPDYSHFIRYDLRLPQFHSRRLVSFNRIIPLRQPRVYREHFWEIGVTNHTTQRIQADIEKSGFQVTSTYRVFENPSHRFFILHLSD
ncbi:MAG: class I SAM-dependent methyltransferase [Caldilineaceae bacterium]|nr:class I SAM-dependent methyltransferase [Caldilineaceae bacterium]